MTETSQQNSGDLVQLAGNPQQVCKKICGRIGCKRDILSQQCIGIMSDEGCLSNYTKSPEDLAQATQWITGKVGDMTWLTKPDSRINGKLTPFAGNPTPIKTLPAVTDRDTSHLSDVSYFRHYETSLGYYPRN